jgi:transposase
MARKIYSDEFRRQAVELYESTPGATYRGIAADLGITRNTLKDWVTTRGRASTVGTTAGTTASMNGTAPNGSATAGAPRSAALRPGSPAAGQLAEDGDGLLLTGTDIPEPDSAVRPRLRGSWRPAGRESSQSETSERLGQARRGRDRRRLHGGTAGLQPPPVHRGHGRDRARHQFALQAVTIADCWRRAGDAFGGEIVEQPCYPSVGWRPWPANA